MLLDSTAEKERDFADAWRPAGQPVYWAESGSHGDGLSFLGFASA
jgi:hypothetical protein